MDSLVEGKRRAPNWLVRTAFDSYSLAGKAVLVPLSYADYIRTRIRKEMRRNRESSDRI